MKRIIPVFICLVMAVSARLIVPDQVLGDLRLSIERLQSLDNKQKGSDVDDKLLKAVEIINKMTEDKKWREIERLIYLDAFVSSKYYDELLYLYSVHLTNIKDVSKIDAIWDKVSKVQDSIHVFPLMLSRMIAFRNARTDNFSPEVERIIQFLDSLPNERRIHGPVIEGNIVFGHSIREDYSIGDLPKVATIREYMESPVPLSGFSEDTQYLFLLESRFKHRTDVVYSERLAKLYERSGDLATASIYYGHVAENYKNSNNFDKAMTYINIALAKAPNNARNIQLKKEIELAIVLKKENSPQEKTTENSRCDNSYFFDHNKTLSPDEKFGKSKEDLQLMINEVFARHGRTFKSSDMQRNFSTKCWYMVNDTYSDSLLTETDRQNISILLSLHSDAAYADEME